MIYYKHFIGDYQRDTMRLSMVEDAAYRRLLDEYYASETPLPADVDECCRAARAITDEEKAAVAKVLDRFFTLADGAYHNKRADKEIATRMARAVAGGKGGRNKWHGKPDSKTDSKPEAEAKPDDGKPDASHSHSQNPGGAPTWVGAAAPRGSRIPEDWQPSDEDRAHARSKGLSDAAIAATAEAFRDYWTAESGQKARKRDWSAAWRTWIRRDLEGGMRGRGGRPVGELAHKPSGATLSEVDQGYRAGVFGRERKEGASADWQRGYAKGVEEAERSRREPAAAEAAPCRREPAPRVAQPVPRVEIPDEVRSQLPPPPQAEARAPAPSEPAPAAPEPESVDDLMEIPDFLRRAPRAQAPPPADG